MRIPSWPIVTAAVVMAVPFGWGLGVVVAATIVGRDVGALPALTAPIGIVGSIVFALSRLTAPPMRLIIMTAGTVLFLWLF